MSTMKHRPDYKFSKYDELTAEQQALLPPLAERQAVKCGELARIRVVLDDGTVLTPWLEVKKRLKDGSYLGCTGIDPDLEFLRGLHIVFTPDHVIDL
jgi:hypothetical protein